MEFDINDLGKFGLAHDTPAYMLPPEYVTHAMNMRCVDDGLERLSGWEQVFGTPTVAPHFHMQIRGVNGEFVLYVSLTKAYGYDGTTHTNITRQSGGVDVDYTATETAQWNGTFLGGVPIVNNGVDVPQFWSTIALATKLANLTNWPSTLRARVVRAFGPHLVAGYITKSGTPFPHMIKWSHPAEPGSVPSSWDETDETKDTGEKDLPDVNSGFFREMLPLGDTMFIYKDNSTWKMRYIGGRFIFDFGQSAWLTTSGILAPRCVAVTGDGRRQIVATQDDIIWHNGNSVQSILDKREKRKLFNEMDAVNYVNSFMFVQPTYNEVWFCYPTAGNTNPNKALIINYGSERFALTEADGITFRNASIGEVENPSDEDWEATEELWDDDTGPWSELSRRRVILAGTDATKFYNMDRGATRDGVTFTGTLQRIGLSMVGKKRDGSPIVDHQRKKMLNRMWPKVQGGPVSIRFGAQQVVDGPIAWGSVAALDPTTQRFVVPGPVSGSAVGWEMSAAAGWRLDGYKVNVNPLGQF